MANTLKQQYEENREKITQYCGKHNMKIVELEDAFHIFTSDSSWKLTENAFFRKNTTRGYQFA